MARLDFSKKRSSEQKKEEEKEHCCRRAVLNGKVCKNEKERVRCSEIPLACKLIFNRKIFQKHRSLRFSTMLQNPDVFSCFFREDLQKKLEFENMYEAPKSRWLENLFEIIRAENR